MEARGVDISIVPVVASQTARPETLTDAITGIQRYADDNGLTHQYFLGPAKPACANYISSAFADETTSGVPVHSPTLVELGYDAGRWDLVASDVESGSLSVDAFTAAWLNTITTPHNNGGEYFNIPAVIGFYQQHKAIADSVGMGISSIGRGGGDGTPLSYEGGNADEIFDWRPISDAKFTLMGHLYPSQDFANAARQMIIDMMAALGNDVMIANFAALEAIDRGPSDGGRPGRNIFRSGKGLGFDFDYDAGTGHPQGIQWQAVVDPANYV